MLEIIIPETEYFDEYTEEFVIEPFVNLQLEHSLLSISKWEAKWCKPFLNGVDKTVDEIIDYVRCMSINKNIKPEIYERLTEHNIQSINKYIEAPMTATTFSNLKETGSKDIITSEIIYYWMVSYNIPFECQKWHLNRLLTLVKVCNAKNSKPEKMSQQQIYERNKRLNEERRKAMNSNG